jgi:hypothetical protein
MKKTSNLAKRFLEEMKSSESSELLEKLIEELETKTDPDPVELYLLETLYQFKERQKITEAKLSSYLINSHKSLPGNKLNDLYDSLTGYGTSKLFKS